MNRRTPKAQTPNRNRAADRRAALASDAEAHSQRDDEYAILNRAIEVIGDRGDAMRWMGTPVRALQYATPVSLLHTAAGRKDVLTALSRLEHGVL